MITMQTVYIFGFVFGSLWDAMKQTSVTFDVLTRTTNLNDRYGNKYRGFTFCIANIQNSHGQLKQKTSHGFD